ncbi:hypothetical protein HaLaN_05592, partial [Haematococcus lacustris]
MAALQPRPTQAAAPAALLVLGQADGSGTLGTAALGTQPAAAPQASHPPAGDDLLGADAAAVQGQASSTQAPAAVDHTSGLALAVEHTAAGVPPSEDQEEVEEEEEADDAGEEDEDEFSYAGEEDEEELDEEEIDDNEWEEMYEEEVDMGWRTDWSDDDDDEVEDEVLMRSYEASLARAHQHIKPHLQRFVHAASLQLLSAQSCLAVAPLWLHLRLRHSLLRAAPLWHQTSLLLLAKASEAKATSAITPAEAAAELQSLRTALTALRRSAAVLVVVMEAVDQALSEAGNLEDLDGRQMRRALDTAATQVIQHERSVASLLAALPTVPAEVVKRVQNELSDRVGEPGATALQTVIAAIHEIEADTKQKPPNAALAAVEDATFPA